MTTWRELLDLDSPTEERNPATIGLDTLPTDELVGTILAADEDVLRAVRALSAPLSHLVDACVEAIIAGATVHYVGAGTSGRLAVLDAAELPPTFNVGPELFRAHLAGGPQAMVTAGESAEDSAEAGASLVAEHCGEGDVVIGLAASGRTPYVRGALEAARARGLVTALISANPKADLTALADHALLAAVGPEVVTGSTRMKAGTAQKLLLNALSTATMVRLGKTYSNLMIDVRASNEKLVARTVRMLVQASQAAPEHAERVLRAAGGSVRIALIALLAESDVEQAAAASQACAPDPRRAGDPAGIRAAVARLQQEGAE